MLTSDWNPAETDVGGMEPEFPVTQAERSATVLPDREVVWDASIACVLLYKERVKVV